MTEGKVYPCPDCDYTASSPGSVIFHRIAKHGYTAAGGKKSKASKATPPRTPAPPKSGVELPGEAQIAATVEEAVGNMRGVGAFLHGTVGPHSGTAIMGVEAEGQIPGAVQIKDALGEDAKRWWLVRSRAVMAGPVILEQAKRDVRVYAVLVQFNRLFKWTTGMEVIAGVSAAVAVDAGLPPEFGFQLGRLPIQPIPQIIPDVLEFVAWEQQQAAAEGQPPAPPAPPGPDTSDNGQTAAEVVQGGVEAT